MNRFLQIISILLVFVLTESCSQKSTANSNSSSSDERRITFELISDYCGGANPPQEVLDALNQPKPAKNEKLTLVSQNAAKDNLAVTTDDVGKAVINLPQGTYQVFLAEKMKKTFNNADDICKDWLGKQNGLLTISSNQEEYTVRLKRTCNPCTEPSK